MAGLFVQLDILASMFVLGLIDRDAVDANPFQLCASPRLRHDPDFWFSFHVFLRLSSPLHRRIVGSGELQSSLL